MTPGADREDRAAAALSFGEIADAYDDLRPDWPAATVAWLAGEPVRPVRVLDLGAGTGKLTAALVALGHEVIAVDPDPAMLGRLREAVPAATTLAGRAEDLPLPDAAVDAVVCGQAWHWVDPGPAAAECARVLRDGGTLGIGWHRRDLSVAWQADLERLVDRDGDATAGLRDGVPALAPPFGPVRRASFRYDHVLPAGRLRDLADTWSYVRRSPRRAEILAGVTALAARTAGTGDTGDTGDTVTLRHVTACFRAARGPRGATSGVS